MSYVVAVPELLSAAATDVAGIGSALNSANAAAALPTTQLLAAAADEVSAANPVKTTLTGVETYNLKYPDGPHNAESLIVDPKSGEMVIIDKTSAGNPTIYEAPGGLANGSTTTMQAVGTLPLGSGGGNLVTGADISADGTEVAVRTYDHVLLWNRDPSRDIATVLEQKPVQGPVPTERQGE